MAFLISAIDQSTGVDDISEAAKIIGTCDHGSIWSDYFLILDEISSDFVFLKILKIY